MKQSSIYQHFDESEYSFIDRVFEIIKQVEDSYSLVLTEFLNPRQIDIVKKIVDTSRIKYFVSSDFFEMEYSRVILAPDYYVIDTNDFELSVIELSYSKKFKQVTHSQILGTLIHQLGLKRTLIGDITISEGFSYVIIDRKFSEYALINISKIASVGVKISEKCFDDLPRISRTLEKQDILVASLRIDALLASITKLSRAKVIKFIESEKVKLNYRLVSKNTELVSVGDMISVRGFGRFTVLEDKGFSKSGKYKLVIGR